MVVHDMHIGKFLKLLDELGIADWKLIFMEQKAKGTMRVWQEPF